MKAPQLSAAGGESRPRRRAHRQSKEVEPSAIDLIEQAVGLLRQTSLSTWSIYLCGLAPFILGLLFFWTEMASSGLATDILPFASLCMGVLFIWLKATQAFLGKGIRDALGATSSSWSAADWLRVIRVQACWQPSGLLILPISFVLTVPFAWVFSFYLNVLMADPRSDSYGKTGFAGQNWRLARIWLEQSWTLLSVFGVILFFTWLNWLTLFIFVPYLLKALLGIETIFSLLGMGALDSTAFFACLLLAFAVTDPIVKAVYVLRQHYALSVRTGSDLLIRLDKMERPLRRRSPGVSLFVAFALTLGATNLEANDPSPRNTDPFPSELDQSIQSTLEHREFVWRFPREDVSTKSGDEGWLRSFARFIKEWKDRLDRWWDETFRRGRNSSSHTLDTGSFPAFGEVLSYLAIVLFVLLVLYLAYRSWRSRLPRTLAEEEVALLDGVMPDLADENVSADQLPKNEWLELARQLVARGEYRLALRALFLAQLADFANDGLISIKRAKSNREYAAEIQRKAHGRAEIIDIYRREVRLFEGVWYGLAEAGLEDIKVMESLLARQGVQL